MPAAPANVMNMYAFISELVKKILNFLRKNKEYSMVKFIPDRNMNNVMIYSMAGEL